MLASPTVTLDLLGLHAELHAHLAHCTQFPPYLAPGVWVPHSTLYFASDLPQMAQVLELVAGRFAGLAGEIQGFGILDPPAHVDTVQCALRG